MKEYTGRRFESWEEVVEQMEVFSMRKISNVYIVGLKDVIWEEKTKVLYLVQDLMDSQLQKMID